MLQHTNWFFFLSSQPLHFYLMRYFFLFCEQNHVFEIFIPQSLVSHRVKHFLLCSMCSKILWQTEASVQLLLSRFCSSSSQTVSESVSLVSNRLQRHKHAVSGTCCCFSAPSFQILFTFCSCSSLFFSYFPRNNLMKRVNHDKFRIIRVSDGVTDFSCCWTHTVNL